MTSTIRIAFALLITLLHCAGSWAANAPVKIVSLDPRFNLGKIKFLQAKYEEAVAVFQRCLKLDAKNVIAGNGLGFAFEQMNQPDSAVEAYRNASLGSLGKRTRIPRPS